MTEDTQNDVKKDQIDTADEDITLAEEKIPETTITKDYDENEEEGVPAKQLRFSILSQFDPNYDPTCTENPEVEEYHSADENYIEEDSASEEYDEYLNPVEKKTKKGKKLAEAKVDNEENPEVITDHIFKSWEIDEDQRKFDEQQKKMDELADKLRDLNEAEMLKEEATRLLLQEKDEVAAIKKFQEALEWCPFSEINLRAKIYSNIAICFKKKEAWEDVIHYTSLAFDEDPTFIKPLANRADAMAALNRTEDALKGIVFFVI